MSKEWGVSVLSPAKEVGMGERIKGRILVVDDDKNSRALCSEVLSIAGYKVDMAGDGIDALEMLTMNDYDLILTDINMPRLDGNGLFEMACVKSPAFKESFVFMTGDTRSVFLNNNKKLFVKPFKIKDLLHHVDSIMLKKLEGPRISSEALRKSRNVA